MRRSVLSAALTIVLVAPPAAPLPAAPRPKDRPAAAHYFPTTVGARWVYQFQTGDYIEVVTDVRRADGGVIVSVAYERPGEQTAPVHTMALRADGLYMLDEVGKAYDPPVCMLKLPVTVGDRWEGQSSRPDLGPFRYVKEVKGVKKVQTPAGTFEAVGVESEWVIGPAKGGEKSLHWYAPGVGRVEIEKSRVLKSFSPGKKAGD